VFSLNLRALDTAHFSVSGTVIDSNEKPVGYATVTVLNAVDSVLINGTAADESGHYTLHGLPAGEYVLAVSHLLYIPQCKDIKISEDVQLPPVTLSPKSQSLDEITVKANFIRHQADRYVVSLQNNPLTKGNTAAEVLAQLPGVYRQSGAIKIYGRDVSRFYIDNRQVRNLVELDAIQADMIDKVEIIYFTGSEYSAADLGGVIKIKLKKIPEAGYYGLVSGDFSLNPSYGYTGDHIYSLFNYRYKKLSIYNNLNYSDNENNSEYDIRSIYSEINRSIHTQTRSQGWGHSLSDNLSLMCELNPMHSIGANASISANNASPRSYSQSETSESNNQSQTDSRQYQTALNYQWQIDKKGSNFKWIADYLYLDQDDDRNYEYLFDRQTPALYSERMQNNQHSQTNMFETTAKFELKLGKIHQLDFGGNISLNRTNRVLDYQPETNLNDDYRLTGDSYAVYFSFASIWRKLMYKAGLRAQKNTIAYDSHSIHRENTKTYSGLYPTVNLTYLINPQKGNMLNLAYMRGMNDIPYSAISPTVIYNNEYSQTRSNLNLRPAIYNAVMGVWNINNNWNFNYMFAHGSDIIYYTTQIDANNPLLSYSMPVNAYKTLAQSLGTDIRIQIFKWWNCRLVGKVETLKYQYQGTDPYAYGNDNTWKTYLSIDNSFTFKNDWGGNLNWNGEPDYKTQERIYKTVHGLSGKVYKYLLNKQLLLNVNVVVYNKNRTLITERENYWSNRANTTQYSRINISLTYNFNHGKKVKVRRTENIQKYQEIKDSE
jgi:hypothetical protein